MIALRREQGQHRQHSVKDKSGVDVINVKAGKGEVMTVRQQPSSRDDFTLRVVTDGLELPQCADQLQVANVLSRGVQHLVHAVVDLA